MYQSSPAFQAYLQAKTRGAPVVEDAQDSQPAPAMNRSGKMQVRFKTRRVPVVKDTLLRKFELKIWMRCEYMINDAICSIEFIQISNEILPSSLRHSKKPKKKHIRGILKPKSTRSLINKYKSRQFRKPVHKSKKNEAQKRTKEPPQTFPF